MQFLFLVSLTLFLLSYYFCKLTDIHSPGLRGFVQTLLLLGILFFLMGLGTAGLNKWFSFFIGHFVLVGFLVWLLWHSPWAKPRATVQDIR